MDDSNGFSSRENKKCNKLGEESVLIKHADKILEEDVGKIGLFHVYVGFFVLYAQAAMATGVYASVFSDYTPKYHCSLNSTRHEYDEDVWKSESFKCQTETGEACEEFVYDDSIYGNTASQEFNIVCDKKYLKGLSGVLRMSGLLIGSFVFGWLSDILGRVISLSIGGAILVAVQIMNVFSINYLMFSICNLLTAASGIGIYIVAYVYIFEWVPQKLRTTVCVLAQIPFSLGFLYLVLVAFFIRTWRFYQLFLAVPNLLLLGYKYILPESPRWLSIKGKLEEAKASLTLAANMNKNPLPSGLQVSTDCDQVPAEEAEEEDNINIWTLAKERYLLFRLVVMSFNWVVITMSFYGLSLGSARNEDLFQNVSAMAAVEMPAYLFCAVVIHFLGRKPLLVTIQVLSGLSCLSAGLIPSHLPTLKMACALMGKMGASAGFSVIYVYTAELFPTKVRNSAIGLCSTVARVGGMVAPIIADLEDIYAPLPFLMMGCASIVAGSLVIFLPESQGKPLPQTLEESRTLGKPLLKPQKQ